MRSYFTWNGKNSLEIGLIINSVPDFSTGQRVISKEQIPGLSGDLVFDTGAYANTVQIYDIWFKAGRMGTAAAAKAVATWLLSTNGYQRLEDSYDPEVYRMAVFIGPVEVGNWLQKYGRASLQFDCKPQRFLKSGERVLALAESGLPLYNPGMEAKPLLTVYGTGAGTVTAGGRTVQLKSIDGFVTLDCELQNAYKGTQNKNGTISAPEFPSLPPGESAVTWTGGVQKIEMLPRWWTL